ncbi:MAG: DNA replication/repair protein RecF [Candidatus Rokuibacteriota bacterium]
MHIRCFQTLEFRNYRSLSYTPSPRLNLLTGHNAQGKTNLLEALAVLLTGRSFRTSRLADLPRWGAEAASLSGEVERIEGGRAIRRAIQRLEDGTWQATGVGIPWARVIVFGWQDVAILHGAPTARRGFIDGFAARLFPSHLPALLRYRRIVARRNHLLQRRAAADVLAPWDEQLAEAGAELIGRRRRAVAALQTELQRVYPALSGERHKVEIGYSSTIGEAAEAPALLEALARARAAELRRGLTLVGPHRDDLSIELDGVDARTFGSRGQQRLLALALRLAEVLPVTEAAGTAPVLLLDDALSELDPVVRDNVLHEIRAAEQVFLTSPDPLVVDGAARWIIERGGIAAA